MCGICGQFNYETGEPVELDRMKIMTDSIAHRGPDDEGFFLSGALGLGFRRLSIIDLAGGHQPMCDRDESVWVVFNGEIYNFQGIRKELEGFGHVFRTNSDTEVIVHGYVQWDIGVLNRLNGMFGMGIWDARKRRLVLARDAMGIKPLYYKIDGGRLYFGSEVRAILAGTGERPDLDTVALNLFLRYRYTPAPLTLFKGINKLAAGTMLLVENGEPRPARWYKYKPLPFSPQPAPDEAGEELLAIYKRAVKRQLISDVPVGLLLSGGIDSGLLLGLMNLQGNSWPTFTVGYGEVFKDDELSDAAKTAEIFGARHSSVHIDKSRFEAALPRIMSSLEEPVATSSIVPMYFVCERARQDVKVALIGQGPDELFGGYTRHLGIRYGAYWRALPAWLKTALARAIQGAPRNEALKRGVYSLDTADRMRRYQQVFSIMPGHVIDSLFQDGALTADTGDKVLNFWQELQLLSEDTDELGGFQFLEIRSSLPDELLMFADKMSMAHSLEVRVPYLDREIVEYVEKLGAGFKVRNGSRKWLHRRICRQFMPKEILGRKKRGFGVNVVDQWLKESLSGKMHDYLLDGNSLMFKYLSLNKVKQLFSDHSAGRNDNYKILFSLVAFEEWLRSAQSLTGTIPGPKNWGINSWA
jgi:asparagine synthase (glutamine-hydrolysing)